MLDKLKAEQLSTIKPEDLAGMVDFYQKLGDRAFVMTHFDLAKTSGLKPAQWQEFLSTKTISEYIDSQTMLIRETQARKATLELGSATSSVDVAKAKAIAEIKRKDGDDSTDKPYNIYFLPSEVLQYRKVVEQAKQLLSDMIDHGKDNYLNDVYQLLCTIVPDKA